MTLADVVDDNSAGPRLASELLLLHRRPRRNAGDGRRLGCVHTVERRKGACAFGERRHRRRVAGDTVATVGFVRQGKLVVPEVQFAQLEDQRMITHGVRLSEANRG